MNCKEDCEHLIKLNEESYACNSNQPGIKSILYVIKNKETNHKVIPVKDKKCKL